MALEMNGIIIAGDGNVMADGGATLELDKTLFGDGPYTIRFTPDNNASTSSIETAALFTLGTSSIPSTNKSDKLIVGKGNTDNPSNALRITDTAVYIDGNYNASGADYAEMFEWDDENILEDDRCGRFVTLQGEKIRLANKDDDFILGIISGNPSVIGNVQDDQWKGMYLYDIYGRPIYEDVIIPAQTNENGDIIIEEHTERQQKLNPAYDNKIEYIPRSKRPEWDAVGMLGKLVVLDDGTCKVNEYCYPSIEGIATHSNKRTSYRVLSRLDKSHIKVLILT